MDAAGEGVVMEIGEVASGCVLVRGMLRVVAAVVEGMVGSNVGVGDPH